MLGHEKVIRNKPETRDLKKGIPSTERYKWSRYVLLLWSWNEMMNGQTGKSAEFIVNDKFNGSVDH